MIFQFVSVILQQEVHLRRVSFKSLCPLGKVTHETLLHLLYLPTILLDDVLDDMVFLINTDSMLNLDNGNVEELYFRSFLEGIIKENINLLH